MLFGLLFSILLNAVGDNVAPRPNLVIVLADDLGWGDVGFHGSKHRTPNLDRLQSEGVELCWQYVNPMCSPTRAALLSGRYASRFGVTGAQNERAFPWGTTTLASALRDAGYETALIGKWHLGSNPEWGPQKFGFDHSYGSLAGGCGPLDHRYKKGQYSQTWHRNGHLIEETGHITDLIAAEAIQWLSTRSRAGKPYFLYVPFTAVHIPIDEPSSFVEQYHDIAAPSRRQYAASVSHLDAAIGRIVAAIVDRGDSQNTLLVFLSDNGATPNATNNDKQYPNGERYTAGPAGGSNLPLRGNKTQLYDGGIRVPAFAYWPGRLKPGKCQQVIHAADWMPTLCRVAGCRPAANLNWDGIDIWPALAHRAEPQPRVLYWAGVGYRSSAVRDRQLKLVVTKPTKDRLNETVELFDLENDPYERSDLAANRPKDVERLRELMAQQSARDRDALVEKAR